MQAFNQPYQTIAPQRVKPLDHYCLTKMDIEILKGRSNGLNYKEIAKLVFRSKRTVETYGSNLLAKMECTQIDQAVAKAIRLKIID